MLLPDSKVSWELQCNVILHCNTSCTLELFAVQFKYFISLLCLFDAIWIYLIYIESKFRKWENKDDFNIFLNGPNLMQNGIVIPMQVVMAFFKVTHQKVYLSVNTV